MQQIITSPNDNNLLVISMKTEGEQDLGPKMGCFSCDLIVYCFEYNDHLHQCLKNNPKYAQKSNQNPSNAPRVEPLKEQQQKELEEFMNNVSQVSRIRQKKKSQLKQKENIQFIKEIKEDPFDQLPCPFCAKALRLDELQHMDICSQASNCIYCKDKFPNTLLSSHIAVCEQKNSFFQEQPPVLNSLKSSKASKISKEELERSRLFPRRQFEKEVVEELNPSYFDNLSRVRHQQLKGLSQSQINGLKLQVFVPVQEQQSPECAICTEEFKTGQLVLTLKCAHAFHQDCLQPWLKDKSTCPTCKRKIKG